MKENDYSPKKVASEIGVSLQLIYYWLNGTRMPSGKNMSKLLMLSENSIDANTFFK